MFDQKTDIQKLKKEAPMLHMTTHLMIRYSYYFCMMFKLKTKNCTKGRAGPASWKGKRNTSNTIAICTINILLLISLFQHLSQHSTSKISEHERLSMRPPQNPKSSKKSIPLFLGCSCYPSRYKASIGRWPAQSPIILVERSMMLFNSESF